MSESRDIARQERADLAALRQENERLHRVVNALLDPSEAVLDLAVGAGWDASIEDDPEKQRKRGRWLFKAMVDAILAAERGKS